MIIFSPSQCENNVKMSRTYKVDDHMDVVRHDLSIFSLFFPVFFFTEFPLLGDWWPRAYTQFASTLRTCWYFLMSLHRFIKF